VSQCVTEFRKSYMHSTNVRNALNNIHDRSWKMTMISKLDHIIMQLY